MAPQVTHLYTLKHILLVGFLLPVCCTDYGSDIQWPEWGHVAYKDLSFSVPPQSQIEYEPDGPPELVAHVYTNAQPFMFSCFLYSGPDLHDYLSEFVDATYQIQFDKRYMIDGRNCRLVRYANGHKELSRIFSLYFPRDAKHVGELLLWVGYPGPEKDYITDVILSSIRLK